MLLERIESSKNGHTGFRRHTAERNHLHSSYIQYIKHKHVWKEYGVGSATSLPRIGIGNF